MLFKSAPTCLVTPRKRLSNAGWNGSALVRRIQEPFESRVISLRQLSLDDVLIESSNRCRDNRGNSGFDFFGADAENARGL